MKQIIVTIALTTCLAGCGGGAAAIFDPTGSLNNTLWAIANTILTTDCPTEQDGDEETGQTLSFTQTDGTLTVILYIPAIDTLNATSPLELGGSANSTLTGTRDGANFTFAGPATIIDKDGCTIVANQEWSGTINDDGTIAGESLGTTSANDVDLCKAVLDSILGEQLASFLYNACTSRSSYTGTLQ